MSRVSRILFGAVVVAVTGAFVALGFWQLDRHREQQADAARRQARLEMPGVRLPAPGVPTDSLDGRRVTARGTFDYAEEVVLAPRSYRGTPGVYLLTPLRTSDSLAVAVLRGSMPAPDGFHARLEKARPSGAGAADAVTVRGVALLPPEVDPVTEPDTLHAAGGVHPVLPRLDLARVREEIPYRLADVYVRADSTTAPIRPADGIRVPAPVSAADAEDGPHLTYALQWFSFALIAVVGGGLFLWRSRD